MSHFLTSENPPEHVLETARRNGVPVAVAHYVELRCAARRYQARYKTLDATRCTLAARRVFANGDRGTWQHLDAAKKALDANQDILWSVQLYILDKAELEPFEIVCAG